MNCVWYSPPLLAQTFCALHVSLEEKKSLTGSSIVQTISSMFVIN